jgi:hypothetical protein
MSYNKNKRRRTACSGQVSTNMLHVNGSETVPLFIIEEAIILCKFCKKNHKTFKLYFKRKSGYKFKKNKFMDIDHASSFAESYLDLCCIVCKKNGIVQKIPNVGGVYFGGSRFPHSKKLNRFEIFKPDSQHKVICPVCKNEHILKVKEAYYRSLELFN